MLAKSKIEQRDKDKWCKVMVMSMSSEESGEDEGEVGVSGGGAPTLLRTSQFPFVGARLV